MKLKLDGWELGITFSACHFLPGHEKCNRLHGHNYAIHFEVEGEPLEDGMVLDFVILKSAMRDLSAELDHCVLMPGNSKTVEVSEDGGNLRVRYENKSYSFPKEDVKVLDIAVISAEMLAAYILDKILDSVDIPDNIKRIGIGVDEGKGQGAWIWKEL